MLSTEKQDKVDRVNLPHKTAKEDLEDGRDQNNITEMVCELLRQQASPELEIDILYCNPIDFHSHGSLQRSSGK